MSELITIGLKPVPKEERQAIVEQVRDAILSGEQDPLKAEIALKGMEDIIDMIRKEIRYYVLKEAAKQGEKTFEYSGATIQVSERKTYDFSKCGDDYWQGLKDAETTAKEARSEREKFLKSIPMEGVVLPNTGEVLQAPSFTTTEILTIKIR